MKFCRQFRAARRRERGQTVILVVLVLGIFLLGFIGIATDFTNLWSHRQAAQSAADAACQAGAADLLLLAQGQPGVNMGVTPVVGASFNCSAKPPTVVPCRYAALNGYDAKGLVDDTASNDATVSFPASVEGVPALDGLYGASVAYIQVTIMDRVHTYFSNLLTGKTTADVQAKAICGLVPVRLPTPIMVLHPTMPSALALNGGSGAKAEPITIIGGPKRAVQVDSSSSTAVTFAGNGTIDLSAAGPTGKGADFGVYGAEAQPDPTNLKLGAEGKWISPATPFTDPYVSVSAPTAPDSAGKVTFAAFGMNGCPDPDGCAEFSPGNYTGCKTNNVNNGVDNGCLIVPLPYKLNFLAWSKTTPYALGAQIKTASYVFQVSAAGTSGSTAPVWPSAFGATVADGTITWTNIGPPHPQDKPSTAIFDPGVYYVGPNGLQLGSNSTVRVSTAAGDGTGGLVFYFSTAATVSVAANSGKKDYCTAATPGNGMPNNCVVSYRPDGAASFGVSSRPLQCPGGAANPPGLPATVDGNILFGPCTGPSPGQTQAYNDPSGLYRGFLFFQNRSTIASPQWSGGGQFLLAGLMYFHDQNSYQTKLDMSGNSGADAYTIGNIVVDQLSLGGSSGIKMILNPSASYSILSAQLLR